MIKATKIYARFATEVYDDFGDCDSYQEYYRKEHVEKELRAIKHALWVARVLRAHTEKLFYFNLGMNTISEKWAWVERKCIDKCIEKAKEYE